MTSAKAFFGELLGSLVFREGRVHRVEDVALGFRRLEVRGEGLRGISWTPGDKVQVFLSGEGMRTYTPMRWDAQSGITEFLGFMHGEGPGAAWLRAANMGDRVRFFGPRGSIDGSGLARSVVLVGDETSFAVASALRPGRRLTGLFEVVDPRSSTQALDSVQVPGSHCLQRTASDGHWPALADQLIELLRADSEAQVVFTGRAKTIQFLRQSLKRAGISRSMASKAYWADGKKGLD